MISAKASAPQIRPFGHSFEASPAASSSIAFDWAYALLGAWLIGGVYLDGRAHNHHQVESFFTLWHGILYSGFLALFAVLVLTLARGKRTGGPWTTSLPRGYGWSLLGGVVFGIGGVFDLLYHLAFGIEAGVEALLSPSHLILAAGAFLLLVGPLRAAWTRPGRAVPHPWLALGPAVLSLTYLAGLLAFFTQYVHPDLILWADTVNGVGRDLSAQALGVSGILVQSALQTGLLLYAIRRWDLPPGSVTVFAAATGLAICSQRDTYALVPAAAAAGIIGDVLIRTLRPSLPRVASLRLFAFAFPVATYAAYFVALNQSRGIGWSIHLWAGSILLAGVVGLFLSYLVAPPAVPGD